MIASPNNVNIQTQKETTQNNEKKEHEKRNEKRNKELRCMYDAKDYTISLETHKWFYVFAIFLFILCGYVYVCMGVCL